MTRRTAALLLLFSVLGLAASTASAWVHYHILRDPSYASFCDISATWSCTAVYESRFGAFRGIPVAIGGLIWFMGALLLSFAAWRSIPPRLPVHGRRQPAAAVVTSAAPAYLFVWSVIGLSFVLYFAYASFVILKTFCILCVLTYVSVIAIFLLSGSGTDIPMRSLPGRFLRDLRAALSSPATLASTVLFVAFAIVTLALFLAVGLNVVASPGWLVRMAVGAAVLLVLIGAALVFARQYARRRPRDRRGRGRVRRIARDTIETLAEPIGRRHAATWMALSIGTWSLGTVAVVLVARSVGIDLSPLEAVFVSAALALGVAIPSSPGYVGTYQWIGVASLGLLDVPVNEALAFTILMQATWYVPTTAAGGAFVGLRALRRR